MINRRNFLYSGAASAALAIIPIPIIAKPCYEINHDLKFIELSAVKEVVEPWQSFQMKSTLKQICIGKHEPLYWIFDRWIYKSLVNINTNNTIAVGFVRCIHNNERFAWQNIRKNYHPGQIPIPDTKKNKDILQRRMRDFIYNGILSTVNKKEHKSIFDFDKKIFIPNKIYYKEFNSKTCVSHHIASWEDTDSMKGDYV